MLIDNDGIQYYKGNPLTSFNGILIWVIAVLVPVVAGLITEDADIAIGMCIILLPVLFLPLSFTLYYFGMASWGIRLRNHGFFWYSKRFYFDDISAITLHKGGKDYRLTIETRAGKKKSYRGHTLSDDKWLALKLALQARGITVNDKVGFEQLASPVFKKHVRLMYKYFTLYIIIGTALSWPVTTWEPETNSQIALRAFLILLLVAAAIYSIKKIIGRIAASYAEAEKQEKEKQQ